MITGSLVAIVTPMHEDGRLDPGAFRKLIDWHVAEGTDGIVVVGTTGESPTVDVDEHKELIRLAVEHSRGRIPIIAGTGGNSTAEASSSPRRRSRRAPRPACRSCPTTTSPRRKACTGISAGSRRRWTCR